MKGLVERSAIFILLLLATGAGIGVFVGQDPTAATSTGGEPVLQLIFGLMYLMVFVFVAIRFKSAVRLVFKEKWIATLCFWCLLSTLWSVEPGETFRRSLALIGSSMVGLLIGMRYEPNRILKMIALCIGIGAVASLVVGFAIPGVGVTADGAWQGVYLTKNVLARMMAFGSLTLAFVALAQRRLRVFCIATIALCFVLMLLAKSATGIVVSLVIFACLPFRRFLAWPNRRLIAATCLIAILAVPGLYLAMHHADPVLGALNRESSLTGRLPLWHLVMQEIKSRPILGYGYAAFWTSSEAARLQAQVTWDAPNAHNSLLETVLGVGLVGVAILILSLFANLIRSLDLAKTDRDIYDYWPFFFLLFVVLYSMTETSMPVVNSILWMAYSANAYWLVRSRATSSEFVVEEVGSGDQLYLPSMDSGTTAS